MKIKSQEIDKRVIPILFLNQIIIKKSHPHLTLVHLQNQIILKPRLLINLIITLHTPCLRPRELSELEMIG